MPVTQHLNVIHGPLSFTENLCRITFRGIVQKTKLASFEVTFFLATSLNTLRGKKDQKWKKPCLPLTSTGPKKLGWKKMGQKNSPPRGRKNWAEKKGPKTPLPGVLRAAATPKGWLATSSSTVHCRATACATRSKPFTRSGLAEIFHWPGPLLGDTRSGARRSPNIHNVDNWQCHHHVVTRWSPGVQPPLRQFRW